MPDVSTTRIQIEGAPSHVSYSSMSSWTRCGNQWYLEKVAHAPARPGWAMLGGSAWHEMTEDYDRGMKVETFTHYMEKQINERVERTPEWQPSDYQASGRATKEWPNKRNLDWWLANGPMMYDRYVHWRETTGWKIWDTPSGEAAIELRFELQLPDGPLVKGAIDRVFELPGGLAVLDLKSGRKPDSTGQNGLYAAAIEALFGVRPGWGFWYLGDGQATELHDLSMWTLPRLTHEYRSFVAGVNAGVFIAKPSNMCGSCGVNKFCTIYGGDEPRDLLSVVD